MPKRIPTEEQCRKGAGEYAGRMQAEARQAAGAGGEGENPTDRRAVNRGLPSTRVSAELIPVLSAAAETVRRRAAEYQIPDYERFLGWSANCGLHRQDVQPAIDELLAQGLLAAAESLRLRYEIVTERVVGIANCVDDGADDSLAAWEHQDTDSDYSWHNRWWKPRADEATCRIRVLLTRLAERIDLLASEVAQPPGADAKAEETVPPAGRQVESDAEARQRITRRVYEMFATAEGRREWPAAIARYCADWKVRQAARSGSDPDEGPGDDAPRGPDPAGPPPPIYPVPTGPDEMRAELAVFHDSDLSRTEQIVPGELWDNPALWAFRAMPYNTGGELDPYAVERLDRYLLAVEGAAAEPPADLPILSAVATAVYEILLGQPPHKGMICPQILDALNQHTPKYCIDESTLTSRIIPELKPYGIENTKRKGYRIPASKRPPK